MMLDSKQQILSQVLDGGPCADDFSLFEDLTQAIKERRGEE
jgi:hypothetical protein